MEDHRDSRDLLREFLRHQGAEVAEAPDGETGLRRLTLTARLPDLILLDLRLPGLSGLEVAHRLKAERRWARIPILAVTALGETADYLATLEAGFDGHLVKPIDHDALLATIVRLIACRPARPSRRSRRPRPRREAPRPAGAAALRALPP